MATQAAQPPTEAAPPEPQPQQQEAAQAAQGAPSAPGSGQQQFRPSIFESLKRKVREAAGMGGQGNNPFGGMQGFPNYPQMPPHMMGFPPSDPFQQQQQHQMMAMMGMGMGMGGMAAPMMYNQGMSQQGMPQQGMLPHMMGQQSMIPPSTPYMQSQYPMNMSSFMNPQAMQQPQMSMYSMGTPAIQPMQPMMSPYNNMYEQQPMNNFFQPDPYSQYTLQPQSPYGPYPPPYGHPGGPMQLYDARYQHGPRWFPERNQYSSVKDMWHANY